MENKIVIGVVSVFVAIVVLAGILMPVIGIATEPIPERADKEGAYVPLMYNSSPESNPYYYLRMTYDSDTGVFTIKKGYTNNYDIQTLNYSEIADKKTIVYADDFVIYYIYENKYYMTLLSDSTTSSSDFSRELLAFRTSDGMQYLRNYPVYDTPSYYYVIDVNGDYANFAGDNPPTMDTPAVSVTGAYIGERYTTIYVDAFGANLYKLMPFLVIIAILVSAVVYFIGKSYL